MKLQEMIKKDEENGNLIFLLGVRNLLPSNMGSHEAYSEICGSYYDGVHQWSTHNIMDIIDCENDKYKGWTITMDGENNTSDYQVYIPQWVMNVDIKNNWKFAKNLFSKHLVIKH